MLLTYHKMKIPQKIKIGGHMFKIEQKVMRDCGETDFHNGIIPINKILPQTLKESTLIHEILCHCLNTTFGHKKGVHEVLDSMSEQIYQVLKDNKLLK